MEELLDISKQQKKRGGIKEGEEIMYSSLLRKANDLFVAISQGIQVPSLWLLSINSGGKEKSEMQVSKQR